jgi:hypothetical protein
MSRPITTLAFFFIALSLFSGTLQATGVAGALHLDQRVGGGEAQRNAVDQGTSIETGAPTGSTLFGMYNVLANQLSKVLAIFNPGLRMLYNAGVPAFLVGGPGTIGLLPPLATLVKFIGLASYLRGWGL